MLTDRFCFPFATLTDLQDGTEKPCSAPFRLVGPSHTCDGKSRRRASPSPAPQRLTPEPPQPKQVTSVEASAQTDALPIPRRSLSPTQERRPNGIHPSTSTTASKVASSSKTKLDAPEESAESLPKRKASAPPSASNGTEKRSRREESELPAPNGAAHPPSDEAEEDATTTAVMAKGTSSSLKNGKHPASPKAKGKKVATVVDATPTSASKAGKKSKKKKKADKEEDDEAMAVDAVDETPSKPSAATGSGSKKLAAGAVTASTIAMTGKAKGKEVSSDDIVSLKGHSSEVFSSAWNPTVPGLLASAGGDATVRIWDIPSKGTAPDPPAVCKHLPVTNAKDVSALEWNPDGTLLASGSYDGILRLWTPQGDLHLVMSMHQGPIFAVRWNRKGTMLLTGSADGHVIVWDLSSGKTKQQFPIHNDSVLDVDWMANKRSLGPSSTRNDATFATASADNSINICRMGEAKPIRTLRGHDDEVNALQFDASQTLLASASDDMTAKIWSIDANLLNSTADASASRSKRNSVGLSKARGSSAALDASNNSMDVDRSDDDADMSSNDLRSSTSASLDRNGRPICKLTLSGHTKELYALAWAPTGPNSANPDQPRMLATTSFDKTARIWNADDGSCLRVIEEHELPVYAISWSPDASFLATGGIDHRVLVNRVSDGEIVKAWMAGGPVFDVSWNVAQGSSSEEGSSTKTEAGDAIERTTSAGSSSVVAGSRTSSGRRASMIGRHQLAISAGNKTLTVLDLGTMADLTGLEEQGENAGEQDTTMEKQTITEEGLKTEEGEGQNVSKSPLPPTGVPEVASGESTQ